MERIDRLLQMAEVPRLISQTADDVWNSVVRNHQNGYYFRHAGEIDSSIEGMMFFSAWKSFFEKFNPVMFGPDSATAEKVKDYFAKNGKQNETLVKKKKIYYLQMPNLQYLLCESPRKRLTVRPRAFNVVYSGRHIQEIRMAADKLADVIRAFDSIVPQILRQKEELVKKLEARKVEQRKKQIVEQMRKQMMDTLTSEYLAPEDLELKNYSFSEDGKTVKVMIQQIKFLEMEIPVASLAETLKDTEHLKESMRIVRMEDRNTERIHLGHGNFPEILGTLEIY